MLFVQLLKDIKWIKLKSSSLIKNNASVPDTFWPNKGYSIKVLRLWGCLLDLGRQLFTCFNGFDYCQAMEVAACRKSGVSKIIDSAFYSLSFIQRVWLCVCSNGFESTLSMLMQSEFILKMK